MVQFTPRLVKIVLSNVRVEDEGGYFCQLYTDATLHQVATLTVLVPPAEPEVEVKEQVVEGGVMELTCIAPRSKPPATLRWYRDRREIPGVTSQQDNDKTVSVSNTIRLAVSRRDDGALVTCEATHPALRGQRKITQHALNVHYMKGEIDGLATEYTANARTLSSEQKLSLLRQIQESYTKCKEFGDDKVQLAMQTYEMVDKHIRRLDTDLARFEADLKEKQIESTDYDSSSSKGKKSERERERERERETHTHTHTHTQTNTAFLSISQLDFIS
ncbi:UNVERIFIED_CONTAM: hypothetical protein FKN15_003653 [Acipenser sinensis]